MKLTIFLLVIVALVVLRRFKPSMLTWVFAWVIGIYIMLAFGFETAIPTSVFRIYMAIAVGGVVAYVFADAERLEEVKRPLIAFLVERRYQMLLALVALAIPAAVAAKIYLDMSAPPTPPNFGRTVHPAPPENISFHDQELDLIVLDNPYRELEESDPAAFKEHVERGRAVYYKNCFYCHGDLMRGEGMFAHGLNPIPTNFEDAGTIAQLQESFLFWRIAKGGPGLPTEGGPWASFMPAWESFLQEDEIWDVILFLYDFTDQRPRARHQEEH